MSLTWWKSSKDASALPHTGKFGAQGKPAPVQQDEDTLSPILLIGTPLFIAAVLITLIQTGVNMEFLNFQVAANMAMVATIASTLTLLARSATAPEKRRTYVAITFGVIALMITVGIAVLPILPDDTRFRVARMWMSFMIRTVFAILFALSVFVEHGRSRDLHISITWFIAVAMLVAGSAMSIMYFVHLPEHFVLRSLPQTEEIVPLVLFMVTLAYGLLRGTWRTSNFHYHLVLIAMLGMIAQLAYIWSASEQSLLEHVGNAITIAAFAIPFFSIQTEMYRSYRFAEQYRLKENWITRSNTGTPAGQELSPVVFREIAQQLNEAFAITDVTGRIIFANKFMSNMTGKTEEQLIKSSPTQWQHSSVPADFYTRIFARILKDRVMYEGEVQNIYPANPSKSYTAAVRITPVLNEFGQISCCVFQQRNISAEQERAHLLRQMIDTMPLGVMLINVPTLDIALINTEAEYLLSRSGFNVRNIHKFDDIAQQLKSVEGKEYVHESLPPFKTVSTKKASEVSDIAIFLASSTSPAAVWKMQAVPFFHEDGTMHSLLVSFQDISTHHEYEHKMSDFISVASHQLRTPLTSIKWTLDLMRKKGDTMKDEEKKLMFETCYKASERMMVTIQQLLQVAELEEKNTSGAKAIAQLNLSDVMADSLKALEAMMQQKKITIQQSVLKTIPPMHFNPLSLSQIVHNLLENAVRYTPEGGKIDSILTMKDNHVEWTLHDTGIGIPTQYMGRIFEKFSRGDNAQRIYPDGTGLGLYIVKSTLDACGGSIRIESEEGKGTTVYISLPLSQEVHERKA